MQNEFPLYFAPFLKLNKVAQIRLGISRMVVVSWWFQSFNHQFTGPANNLAIALHLKVYGMLCLMTFEQLPLLPHSGATSLHTDIILLFSAIMLIIFTITTPELDNCYNWFHVRNCLLQKVKG